MSRILVTGSTAYDLLLSCDSSFTDGIDPKALEKLSVSYLMSHFERHHGGTGANIAWNLRLLGQNPLLVSTVGSDGGPYKALLNERGVSVDHLEKREDAMTATAIIGSDAHEHQIVFYYPGADGLGSWPDLSEDRDDIAYAIIAPRDEGMMLAGLQWCHEYGVKALFDPGQRVFSMTDDDFHRSVDLGSGVIGNSYEWSVLEERLKFRKEDLLSEVEMIVETRGEDGLSILTREETLEIGACKADQVMNPTGAGDALRAGLLSGLASGWSLRDAGRLGAVMGSYVVEIQGTLLDSLDFDEAWERARIAYGEDLPLLKETSNL